MRVVVTRPHADGARTAAALEARGHEVLLAPLMQVERVTAALSGAWGGVIVTSANAPGAIDDAARPALLGLPVYAVGQRSAEAARAAGFTDVACADGDARDLVRLIAQRQKPAKAPLLYLAGEDRAADLIEALAARGLAAELRVVYRAVTLPFPRRWKPATSRPCCIFPGAARRAMWRARVTPALPTRRWRCCIIACRTRSPSRSGRRAPGRSRWGRARTRPR